MISSNELTGKVFTGFFKIDKPLESIDVSPLDNESHTFHLKAYKYDGQSGLFLAEGLDRFGSSGIVGCISEGEVEFKKVYTNPRIKHHPLRTFTYKGRIEKPDGTITMGGNYHHDGLNERYDGHWRLDSVSNTNELPST